MKLKLLFMMAAIITASSIFAHDRIDTIKVYGGKCDACKQLIEQTLKVDGVKSAVWIAKKQLLIISYTTHSIRNIDIQNKLAAAGFDTEKATASDDAYAKLPKCCKYKRKPRTDPETNTSTAPADHHH